ncbi:TraX family protein [Pseudomonas oryzicola]|uniref:TraX family protein n=1 Tax=Pseudomonas oryzicola TaxID=485876 RepID=UPI003462AAAE
MSERPLVGEIAVQQGQKTFALPRLQLADGALEALKWLALLLMTGDHVNKYLFNETLPYLFEAGRLAMPLFVMVLACNLARPGVGANGAYRRTAMRLCLFGVLATPPFIALGGLLYGAYPLNILFTLLVITLVTAACERAAAGQAHYWAVALCVFVVGGALVEFWWPAVLLGLSVGWYVRRPNAMAGVGVVVSLAALSPINGNAWAFAALPLLLGAGWLQPKLPRWRWLFYGYYPLHLLALWLIRIPMAKAGYLFLI